MSGPIDGSKTRRTPFASSSTWLGYVDGQNIAVEYRHAHGKTELYPELAAQLVRLKVDVMVVGSAAPTLAAKNATQTIPIVFIAPGIPSPMGSWRASPARAATLRDCQP